MNTPSHVAASLLVWRRENRWPSVAAIVLGAMLPDLPMFGFYAYQKLWALRSEREIWSTLYFEHDWQLFFDVFNSIPIAIAVYLACVYLKRRDGCLLALSALVHMLCDLPVHHDDAHRHFWPLTEWRFQSPVSYWDPDHHGLVFAVCELIFSVASLLYIAWKTNGWPMRAASLSTLSLYVIALLAAVAYYLFRG